MEWWYIPSHFVAIHNNYMVSPYHGKAAIWKYHPGKGRRICPPDGNHETIITSDRMLKNGSIFHICSLEVKEFDVADGNVS